MNDMAPVQTSPENLTELTAGVVSAYVTNNPVSPTDLSKLISEVHAALRGLQAGPAEPVAEELKPAVSIRKSVTPDFIVCLEDGKKFKSLKRHLRTAYNMSPEEYRTKWGLPTDYPMVAPNYSATRSSLAKTSGLGRKPAEAPAAPKKRSTRQKPAEVVA